MKILLSEGSGLTSRQVARLLHDAGHRVGVVSSDPVGLTRFTRAVGAWHRVPAFGPDPLAWLEAAAAVHRRHGYDVLLPTQEQVTVLSWAQGSSQLDGVRTVVPPFDALRAVQDKVAAHATLSRLGLAQPETAVLATPDDLAAWDRFPVYLKAPVGTASGGVVHVGDRAALGTAAQAWIRAGVFDAGLGGVVAQAPVPGPLAMVQAVFDDGRLVAFHANQRVREGARGGASHKRSLALPEGRAMVERLGRDLGWHGALSADLILGEAGPVVIDVNPRLVEPANAARAGVDLVGALLEVADGTGPAPRPDGRPDVGTHQLLLAVLGAAQHGRGRRGVGAELWAGASHRGPYRHSHEELTPVAHDWRAVTPLAMAALATLVLPATWEWFSSGSVANYAITPQGWADLCSGARPSSPA